MKALRPHQSLAINMLRDSLRNGKRRPMLQVATGGGKTVIAASIIRMAREKDKRVVFVVDALSLIDQTVEAFYGDGIHGIGVIQADHPMRDYSKPVQIASVQTLRRRGMPKADLVVVDEAHSCDKWLHALMASPEWADVPFIGLSATPWAKGLGLVYDDLLQPIDMQGLIDAKHLCEFRVFAASKPDLSGVKTVAGEYHEGQLAEVMSEGGLIADAVKTWLEQSDRRPSLVFAVDCAHAQKLQQRFQEAGVGAGYIDAYTERADRKIIKGQLDRGEIQVVCNVGTLVKGVDWSIGCISDCAPTKSIMRYVQKFGRGLRVNPEAGHDLIYLDHASNVLRHGFPTDIHRDKLCTKATGEKAEMQAEAKKPAECPRCHMLRSAGVKVCPGCGFEVKPKASEIEERDGKLVEIGKPKPVDHAGRDAFYAEALFYAREKGKQDGWAWHLCVEKWGSAPKGRPEPIKPTSSTLGFIQSRNIRRAKGKAKRA